VLCAAAVLLALVAPQVPHAPPPGTALLSHVRLHDTASGMQGFARDPVTRDWYFAQVSQGGRHGLSQRNNYERGNLTITRLSPAGKILGFMYARNMDHGESISVQHTSAGKIYMWTGAKAVLNGGTVPGGTRIARFGWRPGKTAWPSSGWVRLFNPHPGTYNNAPSIDWATRTIMTRYHPNGGGTQYGVYRLADFLAGHYTPAAHFVQPSLPSFPPQGFALMPGGTSAAVLSGWKWDSTNQPPGNTYGTVFGGSGTIWQQFWADALSDDPHEPEGIQPGLQAGTICYGLTSQLASGVRVVSVWRHNMTALSCKAMGPAGTMGRGSERRRGSSGMDSRPRPDRPHHRSRPAGHRRMGPRARRRHPHPRGPHGRRGRRR